MSRSILAYLQHILNESDYLLGQSQGLSKTRFLGDETLKRAFVRSLEIIGEAVKHVDEDFRAKHGQIDWKAIAGMRDRLIHHYFGVDYDIVWDAVTAKVPDLHRELAAIIRDQQAGP